MSFFKFAVYMPSFPQGWAFFCLKINKLTIEQSRFKIMHHYDANNPALIECWHSFCQKKSQFSKKTGIFRQNLEQS